MLTRLLVPAVVEAIADEIDDEDEDVDGEFTTRGGTAVIPLAANICAVFCSWKSGLLRGAEFDRPLGTFGALELRLPAVPVA